MAVRKQLLLVLVVGLALALGASAAATTDASFTAQTAAVAGDCNANGTGDFEEGAWANRDDDADGFCNGIDLCPREATAVNDGTACQLHAITVPYRPQDSSVPHPTYSGASITLKGIARYGGNQFTWDYGDGTAPMPWTAIANAYNLGVRHTYTGAAGQVFIATLSVRNSANPSFVSTATYPIRVEASGPNVQTLDANGFDVRRRMAIDDGLWYLHVSETRSIFLDGAPGYRQPYGTWGSDQADCVVLDTLERHGSHLGGDAAGDPYVEDVQRALALVLTRLQAGAITSQPAGNPDTNGNLKGLTIAGAFLIDPARCLMALADADASTSRSLTGGADVYGRTHAAVAQDMVDWLAFAQVDPSNNNSSRGGWGYAANDSGAVGEMLRWVVLGLDAAERHGAVVPTFVRSELPFYLGYIRYLGSGIQNGGVGDFAPGDQFTDVGFTGGAMIADLFLGQSTSSAFKASEGWIFRHWNDNNGTWVTNLGDSDPMYTVMRAMTEAQPTITLLKNFDPATGQQAEPGFDWFRTIAGQAQQGIATNLLLRQATDGSWTDTTGIMGGRTYGVPATTALDVAILQAPLSTPGPTANIGGPYLPLAPNEQAQLDASQSTSADGSALTYTWDLNGDGVFGDATGAATTVSFPTLGTFSVCVRVTDGGGRSADACTSLLVTPGAHLPHAVLADVFGSVNVPVQLDASASFDVDNDPLTYAWDLDNDGQFDDATGATPTATFALPGDFPIAVRVTDHPELNATPYSAPNGSTTAFAVAHIAAHAPVANAGGPYTAAPGASITLDATASSDPDGSALTFAWDLNNDGLFNDSTATTPVFTAGLVPVGTVYAVCVKVTNPFGRSNTACTTVTVVSGDSTPPTVTPVVTGTAGDNDWYRSDVHLTWQVSDAESSISSQTGCADADVTADTNTAGLTFSCSATSAGGTTSRSVTIKRDAAPPTIAASRTPAPNAAGWSSSDVTVTFTCDDDLSGIAQCPAPTVLHEGAAQTATGTATDNAGNTASAAVNDVNVDETGPSLSGAPASPANLNGWYRADVPVHWTCSDALSGVDGACPSDSNITGEGSGLTVGESVADRAGNVTAAVSSPPVRIDRTPPATSALAPSGWSNSGVTVTLAATDNLSGIATTYYSLDGGPTAYGNSVVIDTEGAHTLAYWSVDNADNVEATKNVTVQIDRSAPTITHLLSPSPNAAGWNNTDVAVSFSCGDSLSGIASCTALQLLTGEGASQHVAGQARDNAGNTADDSATVSIDKTAPSVTASADRAPNGDGWYGADVIVSFICSDGLSGVATCPAAVTVKEGAAQSATGSATDVAGNTGGGSLGGLNVDETPPTVTYSGNAGTYSIADVVSITCNASDALSGVASTSCADISGPAASFGLGTTSRSASATDRAGNVGTGSVSFTVGVSCESVKSLIGQWVSDSGIASSLRAKIDAICSAPNASAKSGKLGAFDNQLAAQTGKALTKEHAALLEQYAGAL